MGRIFETRKATIFARSLRVGRAFTRCSREISIAVKAGGANPESNAALRRAIQNARAVSMPKDKIEGAIKKASGEGGEDFEELVYEGYGPHGVAMLVRCATDNPVRTVANIRSYFKKSAGNLGSTGSVSYMFKHMGVFRLDPEGISPDELELELIDHGLEEFGESADADGNPEYVARCAFADFGALQAAIEAKGLTVKEAAYEYIPLNPTTDLSEDQAKEVLELVARFEEDDDVQRVFHTLA